MPRYRLGILKNKELKYFIIPELEHVKVEDSLKELDKITMQFANDNHLIDNLRKNNIYTEEKNYKLQVIYRNNGKDKKIPVLYNDCKKYMDIDYLRNIIQSYSKDITFLEKLANHYSLGKSSYNPQLTNVQGIRTYIYDVIHSSTKEPFYSKALNDTLDDIITKAVFKINKNTGEAEINYRGLRDLALFVKKYTDNILKKEYEDAINTEVVKGFEYNENYDEPDFAPNSEEEAMYLSYLESLEDEEPDYIDGIGKRR